MKSSGLIVPFVLMVFVARAQGPDQLISCHLRNAPFHQLTETIFQQSGVRVFYEPAWTDPIHVTLDSNRITVMDAVEKVLESTGLEVSIWNGNLVILPGEKLISQLPSFEPNNTVPDSLAEESKARTASEERYLTGRMADALKTIRVGKAGSARSQAKVKVFGRILDEETGEPMSYATMYVSEIKSAAVADVNGFFTIQLKPGEYNALFEFLGYQKERYLLEVRAEGECTVYMRKAVIQMKEFIVHGDRQQNLMAKDAGFEKISMKKIKELPMMMGERNIMNVSALLPGIVSTGEGSSGLNVRGGSSDQNAFYLNKVPIYNTSHLFGFFPAFNADVVKDFSIYKGFIPAQYGGRLSSVFTINTRQGNLKEHTIHGGISPITGNIVVEGPIKRDTCSFLLSARTSYSDWMLRNIQNPDIRSSSASFYDYSGGIQYDVQKTQVSLFAYYSFDRFRLSDLTDFEYSNKGASLSFTRRYSNSLRGEYSVIASQYAFNTTDKQEAPSAYRHAYQLGHYEGRADYRLLLDERNTLDFGAGVLLYALDRGDVKPFGTESLRDEVALGQEKGLESTLYVTDTYEPLPWLTATLGLRFALFTPLGAKTVYTYAPGAPRDPRYIQDSIQFKNNEVIRRYTQPDIRTSLNVETDEYGSVKLAFTRLHQNLFLLNNTVSVAPNAQWKLADYYLKPSMSQQVSLGVFRLIPHLGLEASLEVYYKKTDHFPEFRDGAEFLGTPLVETSVLQGTQKAYGLEFLLKRSSRKLEGWISYTYSRSKVQVNGTYPWDRVNEGDVFPANYDIPHVVNLVWSYHFTRRITLSSIMTYQSGRPVTYPVSVYYVNGVPVLDYSSRNAYRIPHYFRSDISLTFEGNLRKDKLLHSSFVFSLYNLTGRQNPYAVYFQTASGRISSYQYSVIGVPIFTGAWIFKIGNYASE